MNFIEFKEKLQKHFQDMTKDVSKLFEVDLDKDELWNLYLDSFPAGTNKIFRERREHDCSCCRHFIKAIGNAVVIKDGELHTIWELDLGDTMYQSVTDALDKFVKSKAVSNIYVSKFKNIGTDFNYELIDGNSHKWDHFFLELPSKFVDKSSRTEGDIKGEFRDIRNVFKRSLDEISIDALDTVLELIASNSLYRGEEWKSILEKFKDYKSQYDKLTTEKEKELYAWEYSVEAGIVIGKIRNHSIGTLLINISEGMELDLAVKKYEQIVAGPNYKRPKPIFTKKMLEDAKKTISELGYMNSLDRRFANLDDITVNNILFSNKDAAKRMTKSGNVFDEMEKNVVVNPKKFSKVEEISAKDFISNVLPNAKEVEVFVENKHAQNFVSLIAPVDPDAATMFKWNNGLSWAYTGNIADSDLKQNVKAAGGNVEASLRFSIQWNEDGHDNSDLDAHCIEPNKNEIYYATDKKPYISKLGGQLDVDIIRPNWKVAVENIVYETKTKMLPGKYLFFVRQFNGSTRNGFRAEIEFDGEIHSFNYNLPTKYDEEIKVAEVTLNKDGSFSIKKFINGELNTFSREVWNINTNQFVPVSVISYSPNYFDEQDGIGHRHLFFFLKDCINPEEPNGYYNEFLNNDLMKHKRVLEALGSKCHVIGTDDQLSGIGFSMTKRAELIVKVTGNTERIMKIKF